MEKVKFNLVLNYYEFYVILHVKVGIPLTKIFFRLVTEKMACLLVMSSQSKRPDQNSTDIFLLKRL